MTRLLRLARACVHSTYGSVTYRLGWHATARRQFERVLLLRGADFRAYVHLGRIAFDLGDYSGWRREFEHARRTDPARFARLRHPMELFEPRLAGTQLDPSRDDGFDGTDARATWRSLHPFGNESRSDHARENGFARGTDLPLAPGFDPLLPGQQLDEVCEDHIENENSRELDDSTPDGNVRRRPEALPGDRRPGNPPPSLPDASLSRDDFGSNAERRRFQLRRPIDRQEIARCNLDDLARRLSS